MTLGHADLFTPVHKGLRSMLYGLSTRLQTNDFGDLEATRKLVVDLENDFAVARSAGCTLCVLSHHATDEEGFVFPAVAPVGKKLVSDLIEQHHGLTRRELEIARSAHEILQKGSVEARVRQGAHLNRAANALFADYISHMNREEQELVPLMQEKFTDEQMGAMQRAIIGGMPPDRFFAILDWMLPSLNVTELSDLLGAVGRSAPPPVMAAIVELCARKVEPARWQEARRRTGL